MSEVIPSLNSANVAAAFSWWLQEEIINSDEGRNAVLSEYRERRADLFKPTTDLSNVQYQKAISHYGRVDHWIRPYREADLRSNDYFVGRAIFTPLIEVSGSYRKQCFFEASDSEDYFNRRTNQGPTSIHIPEVVSNEFTPSQIAAIDAMSEDERLDYIIERSAKDYGRGLALHQCIHDWAIDHPSQKGQIAAENDEPVLAMQEAQRIYVGLAAGHVLVAASLRDYDLTKVPILEPKSITDASSTPLYPIAA